MFGKVGKDSFDKAHRLGVARNLVSVTKPMCESLVRRVILAVIGFCGGKLITNAFNCRFIRHNGIFGKVKIRPVFNMMLISPLVVKPSARNPRLSAADSYRGAVALIVFYALEKFGRRKFREVVDNAAPDYTALYTVNEHLVFVTAYEKQMLKKILYFHIKKFLCT